MAVHMGAAEIIGFKHEMRVIAIDKNENGHELLMTLVARRKTSCCPRCQRRSGRVHSRYKRGRRDLPVCDQVVKLVVQVRRFFCDNKRCEHKIFAEQIPKLAERYARRTKRLAALLTTLACELGGEAGHRVMSALKLGDGSADTMLGLIRRMADPASAAVTPKVLGMDDWAKRKGQTYGTILCDLEQHCVIDLLPDRETNTIRDWLKTHPGVDFVCRDRSNAYAEGVTLGAPNAVQIADRFHLLMNMSAALKRLADRHYRELWHECVREPPSVLVEDASHHSQMEPSHRTKGALRLHMESQDARRAVLYQNIQSLHLSGHNQYQIAHLLHINRQTIRRALKMEEIPEHGSRYKRLNCEFHKDRFNFLSVISVW